VSNKKAILVLTSTFPRWSGDCEPPFVYELSKRLSQTFDVHVLAPHSAGAAINEVLEGVNVHRYRYFIQRFQTLTYNGGILENLKKSALNYLLVPFFLSAQLIETVRLIRKYPITLIHAHWIIPQAAIALAARLLARKNIPVICTSHGGDLFGLRGKVFSWINRRLIHSVDRLIVVSQAMREHVTMQMHRNDVDVIPMGVDLVNRFTPTTAVARNNQQILFVGRLVEKKGVSYLIEAMKDVVRSNPDAQLFIIGNGPERRRLEELTVSLDVADRIHFLGAIHNSELSQYYQRCSIFVAPSIIADDGDQEGLGLVLVEAMGCGCAVVATDLRAMRDVIIDGVTGLVCEQKNSQSLAAALIKLMDDAKLRTTLAVAGREHVLRKFDWEYIGERYTALMRQCSS
jgi:glycosyltransferase involved in cell wall biosynthesis